MYLQHKPTINLIAAVATDGSIGGNDKLLWKITEDLQYFKARTWNNIVIIGYKTYKSLPKAAFKGRKYIVIIKTGEYNKIKKNAPFGTRFAFSIEDALHVAKEEANFHKRDIYIAGGASIYKQMLQYCDYAHITWVNENFSEKADKFFPISDFFTNFELISKSIWHDRESIKKHPSYQFTTYKKRK